MTAIGRSFSLPGRKRWSPPAASPRPGPQAPIAASRAGGGARRRRIVRAVQGSLVAYPAATAPPAGAQIPTSSVRLDCSYTRHRDGSQGSLAVDVKNEPGWTEASDAYVYRLTMISLDQTAGGAVMIHTIIISKTTGLFIATSVFAGKDGSQVPNLTDSVDTGECHVAR
jgi:hypothetical protein